MGLGRPTLNWLNFSVNGTAHHLINPARYLAQYSRFLDSCHVANLKVVLAVALFLAISFGSVGTQAFASTKSQQFPNHSNKISRIADRPERVHLMKRCASNQSTLSVLSGNIQIFWKYNFGSLDTVVESRSIKPYSSLKSCNHNVFYTAAIGEFLLALLVIAIVLAITRKKWKSDNPFKLDDPNISTKKSRSSGKNADNLSPAKWYSESETAIVAGREIGGNIYIGPIDRANHWEAKYSGVIDPEMSVTRSKDKAGEGVPYWPNYSRISPDERATYLDWLAGGRNDEDIGVSFVFLYFYGIERRFFLDRPKRKERKLLVAEVNRLVSIYGQNYSIQSYLGTFLDVARTMDSDNIEQIEYEKLGFELPLGLRYSIGRLIKEGTRLDAFWMFQWYVLHPETRLRTPARRAHSEFKTLFTRLFNEKYPNGLRVNAPKRNLKVEYKAASHAFEVDLTKKVGVVPDIGALTRPVKLAGEFADQAVTALDRYSRFIGKHPDKKETMEAYAHLPQQLWNTLHSTELENLRNWTTEIIENGGLVPLVQVLERIEGEQPEKLTKARLVKVADTLARLSVGMAPDPRFSLRSPKLEEPVVLFRLPGGMTTLSDVSDQFLITLISLAMGSFIANADGNVSSRERDYLEADVENSNVSIAEKARLKANLKWFLTVEPDLRMLQKRLREVSENVLHSLGRLALYMAAADGGIDPGEIQAIERLYKAMGLSTDSILSDLHKLASRADPVTVRTAKDDLGEYKIPLPPKLDETLIDTKLVASVEADTLHASSILKEIFSDEDEEADDETLDEPDESGDAISGLDPRHEAFVRELTTRTHWSEPEFQALTKQFQLMEDGVLETVNEWSYENFDDSLIEVYNGIDINQDVVAMMRD